jgi:predicted Na+-dependent transporter
MQEGQLLKVGSNQNGLPPHKFRISVTVVGLGALLLISVLNPYQEPPFGGHHYLQWLASIIIFLGATALARKEHGRVAQLSALVTIAASAFLVLTLLGGVLFALALKLLMSD